jgi:hypothetical protein
MAKTKSTTVTSSIVINRPVKEVWDFLTNFNNMPKWARGVAEITEISPGPIGVGTKVTDIGLGIKRRWPETFWVTEFESPKALGLMWQGAYGKVFVRYTLEPASAGTTTLTGHTYGDYRFPFSILLLFMAKTANDNFKAGLANIKKGAEEDGRAGRDSVR